MPSRLIPSSITRVDLVDKGANEHAHIAMWKRDDGAEFDKHSSAPSNLQAAHDALVKAGAKCTPIGESVAKRDETMSPLEAANVLAESIAKSEGITQEAAFAKLLSSEAGAFLYDAYHGGSAE